MEIEFNWVFHVICRCDAVATLAARGHCNRPAGLARRPEMEPRRTPPVRRSHNELNADEVPGDLVVSGGASCCFTGANNDGK